MGTDGKERHLSDIALTSLTPRSQIPACGGLRTAGCRGRRLEEGEMHSSHLIALDVSKPMVVHISQKTEDQRLYDIV
jgi:hypothetical protein